MLSDLVNLTIGILKSFAIGAVALALFIIIATILTAYPTMVGVVWTIVCCVFIGAMLQLIYYAMLD